MHIKLIIVIALMTHRGFDNAEIEFWRFLKNIMILGLAIIDVDLYGRDLGYPSTDFVIF